MILSTHEKDYLGATLNFNDQSSHHIETSQLIYIANKLTGFYMAGTLVVKRLTYSCHQIELSR